MLSGIAVPAPSRPRVLAPAATTFAVYACIAILAIVVGTQVANPSLSLTLASKPGGEAK